MTRRVLLAVLCCCLARVADAAERPLDEREPPYGNGDWSWLNGSNRQPSSLLKWGPITGSIFVDAYYASRWPSTQASPRTPPGRSPVPQVTPTAPAKAQTTSGP